MNREIEFRGKDIHGKWVYGLPVYLTQHGADFNEIDGIQDSLRENINVASKTVGQYTGMKDKNGTKIFEGDICFQMDKIIKVIYRYGCFFFSSSSDDLTVMNPYATDFHNTIHQYIDQGIDVLGKGFTHLEIIGNIYDNPKLLNN